jgi:hypothetical protein
MRNVDFKVFNVSPRKDGDTFWNNIGGAFYFKTQDNRQGINIPSLNVVLIEPKDESLS